MRVSFGNRLVGACIAVLACCGNAAHEPPQFAQTFATDHAPSRLHARVLYKVTSGDVHRITLWRSGDRLLRRDTDDRLTTIVTHRPGDLAYRLDLFDHVRRLHTIVNRESLYQVGTFTDWTGLAYGLQAPKGRYALRPIDAPRAPRAIVSCRWFELTQPGRTSRICWSEAEAFPIMILSAEGQVMWQVTAVDRKPFPPTIFHPRAAGYILNNATNDIRDD